MIPGSHIQEWSLKAPWPDLRQVEQDLIICRVLCDLFSSPSLSEKIAFRGGTAINKLLFEKPMRYSEDIDLVQTQSEPLGSTLNEVRRVLSWFGDFRCDQAGHSTHLTFKFSPEVAPDAALKVKVEINTREHLSWCGIRKYPFNLDSPWHKAAAEIVSFEPEELFGTKLRALLQRRHGRDLFDLHEGLRQLPLDPDKVIACFNHYLTLEGQSITRAMAEERMLRKLEKSLTEDVAPLLPVGIEFSEDDAICAFGNVWHGLIARIPGDPWKLSEKIIEELRQSRLPKLLR